MANCITFPIKDDLVDQRWTNVLIKDNHELMHLVWAQFESILRY